MEPTVDQFSTTTTIAIMTSTPPITHSNNIHAFSAVDSCLVFSYFDVYQETTVGSGDVSIRTLVPVDINVAPYRNTLVAKIFFH